MKNKFDLNVFMASARHEAGEENGAALAPGKLLRLLKLENGSFVRAAYHVFFNRDPDPAGMALYSPIARTLAGRVKLLGILALAPERKYIPPWQRLLIQRTLWLAKFKWLGSWLRKRKSL